MNSKESAAPTSEEKRPIKDSDVNNSNNKVKKDLSTDKHNYNNSHQDKIIFIENERPAVLPNDRINTQENINIQNPEVNTAVLVAIPLEIEESPDFCLWDSMLCFSLNLLVPFLGYIYYCCRYPNIKRKKAVFFWATMPIIFWIISIIIFLIVQSSYHRHRTVYIGPYYNKRSLYSAPEMENKGNNKLKKNNNQNNKNDTSINLDSEQ